jgi:hypothetical protein
MRLVEPAPGNAKSGQERGSADRVSAERVRTEIMELGAAYRAAIERGMREQSGEGIDAAFDEADWLQVRLLKAIARVRVIERERRVDDNVELAPAAA